MYKHLIVPTYGLVNCDPANSQKIGTQSHATSHMTEALLIKPLRDANISVPEAIVTSNLMAYNTGHMSFFKLRIVGM